MPAICVLDNPGGELADLMEHVKGPDFPTRGIIMGRSGIRAAYATGRGRVCVRARTEFEEFGNNRTRIIVTEIPYQVNKRMLIKNMADQVEDKRLEGISDIRDESDRNGMRVVIELKRDANPQVVLNRLFAQTQLQTTFAINMLALVESGNQSQPQDPLPAPHPGRVSRLPGGDHRPPHPFRSEKGPGAGPSAGGSAGGPGQYRRGDPASSAAPTTTPSRTCMNRFGLDDVQAQAILDMRLKALQGLDREKLENEYKELEERIAYFNELLSSEERSGAPC